MTQIFVSYKSQDRDRVRDLVKALQSQAWDVWWDSDIKSGEEWRKSIEKQLAAATLVIVVWTERSAEGEDNIWVLSEASAARQREALIPVMFDPVELPKPFDQIQTVDLTSWTLGERNEAFDAFLRDVGERLAAPPDFGKLPKHRFPVTYLAAGAGAILTGILLFFIKRKTNLDPMLLTVLAAVAGGVTAFGLLWELARYRLRSLKLPLTLAASIIAGLGTFLGGYLLGTADTNVTIEVSDIDGKCPAVLAGKRVFVRSAADPAVSMPTLDGQCQAALRASRAALSATAMLDLEANDAYFVAAKERARAMSLADPPVRLTVTPVPGTPRAQLSLLEYRGARETPERTARFQEFQGILQNKMATLAEQLRTNPDLPVDALRTRQLDRMKVSATGDASEMDNEDKMAYWRQTHSLGLLSGTVTEDGGFEVNSQVFIGDLAGDRGRRSFPLSMRISADEFRRARDTHAVAMLYALALDGKRLGFPRDVVAAYLSEAFEIVQGLGTEDDDEVANLRSEINKALDSLAEGDGA